MASVPYQPATHASYEAQRWTPPPHCVVTRRCPNDQRDYCLTSSIRTSSAKIVRDTSRGTQMDVHYTPQLLASKLVASALDVRPSIVADLCAGRGDLLLQAEALWPNAEFAAVDIDRLSVQRLRRLRTNWLIGRCDLRNSHSRAHSSVLKRVGKRISLLLLNPPFSCRGNARLRTDTPDGSIYASTAMFFLVTSLTYLHESGSAVAVLPHGVLYNQKDRTAWTYVQSRYSISVVALPQPGAFPQSSASTVLIRLSPLKATLIKKLPLPAPSVTAERITVRVTRGCQPLFRAGERSIGPVLVHSTDLRDAKVYPNGRRSDSAQRSITGPAVLIPRVGQLTTHKIAILSSSTPIVLSDCVIGLATNTWDDAQEVRRRIVRRFRFLHAQYVGTGAPFVTLRRLRTALTALGIETDDT